MFADINVCEFVILKVFALLKFATLGLPKVKLCVSHKRCSIIASFKGNGDHSEVRDKFCSNFQNMLIRSL